MNAKPGTERVIDAFMSMDHYERDRAFRHAMLAAFTPIPSNWLERHRAIWLSRRKQLDMELTITREPAINAHAHGYPHHRLSKCKHRARTFPIQSRASPSPAPRPSSSHCGPQR